jgi:hypothetical protein
MTQPFMRKNEDLMRRKHLQKQLQLRMEILNAANLAVPYSPPPRREYESGSYGQFKQQELYSVRPDRKLPKSTDLK